MTNSEFSNEFDVLYNSITSNQAPGLDEYEKSVFLTKAQDEIVKAYFNPRTNKVQEGFDGNEKRQIDFSMILRSKVYSPSEVTIKTYVDSEGMPTSPVGKPFIKDLNKEDIPVPLTDYNLTTALWREGLIYYVNVPVDVFAEYIDRDQCASVEIITDPGQPTGSLKVSLGFLKSFFDMRENTKSVTLEDDILMFINEYVEVSRDASTNNTRLTIVPINYTEYSRLMSKPYKRPLKNQAWRLLDSSNGFKKAELIVGPNDSINKYVIRYIKRPRAIILSDLEGVTLDGKVKAQECELDPILHPELLQRAIELAKAVYIGDLNSQVALGQTSQTNMGVVTQSK